MEELKELLEKLIHDREYQILDMSAYSSQDELLLKVGYIKALSVVIAGVKAAIEEAESLLK